MGGRRRDPHLWDFSGLSQAPTADLGQPVGVGLAIQQVDLGWAAHTPEIVAMGPRSFGVMPVPDRLSYDCER